MHSIEDIIRENGQKMLKRQKKMRLWVMKSGICGLIRCMMNEKDIERLFKAHYTQMHQLAMALLQDGDSARDIVHDVFTALIDVGGNTEATLGNTEVTPGYLMRAVRNRCLNQIRNLSARERIANRYFLENRDYDEEQWPDEETMQAISGIIAGELTPQCRRVVELRFRTGMSYAEISAELQISGTAVYKHLHRALSIIRKKLKENG